MSIYQLKELVWTYFLPLMCLFGMLTNSINYKVFSQRRKMYLRNRMHQYFQFDSAVEFVYLLICLIYFILKSKYFPLLRYHYIVVCYEKYVYFYLATSLAFLMIFLRVFISVKRFLIATHSGIFLKTVHFYKVVLTFALISLVLDLPTIFNIAIVSRVNKTLTAISVFNYSSTIGFELSYKRIESSVILTTLNLSTYTLRGLVAPAVLFMLNITTLKILDQKIRPSHPTQRHLGISISKLIKINLSRRGDVNLPKTDFILLIFF